MGRELRTDIVVGGKAHSSFYQLGNELQSMGNMVNGLSEKLITFGKESVETYASYEDYMLDAKVALRTQYESAADLEKAMGRLSEAALQWASDSRFTTQDVAEGISNAAHAGWNLNQILSGVPAAMNVSLAGSMSLAEGLEYLVDISNAAGVEFGDLTDLVDYWAFAANSSSTTIPEMGQAMQKMGATMQFVKGDMAGLTTMLAVLADNGTKGTEAGTLLRNSMIRLIAPTKAAAEAMDDLGLDEDALAEIYAGSAGLEEANAMLAEAGFSAYDANGNLKNFLDIWKELDAATSGMTEADRNKVLSSIFPTRTITGALALLAAARNDYNGLYDSILANGPGYADYAAETMESGLGGALRHLESVYNALQTRTGGSLADDVATVSGALSGLIERVNGMDEGTFNAIVGGLEVVAAAGPTLLVAGGALKAIAAVVASGPTGWAILGAVGITALAKAMKELNDTLYESSFGHMGLDDTMLNQYLSGMSEDFAGAAEQIERYNEGVRTALDNYEENIGTLKGGLVTAMLTDTTLTQAQQDKYLALGDQIRSAVLDGITGNYSAAMEAVSYFTGADSAVAALNGDNQLAAELMQLLNDGFNAATAQAEQLSANLRAAMLSAFEDGQLSEAEMDNITAIFDEMTKLATAQANAKERTARQRTMDEAQRLGYDNIGGAFDLIDQNKAEVLQAKDDAYYTGLEALLSSAGYKGLSEAETQQLVDQYTALYKNNALSADAWADSLKADIATEAVKENYGESYGALGALAQSLKDGDITKGELEAFTNSDGLKYFMRFLGETIDGFGGLEEMESAIANYRAAGYTEEADKMAQLVDYYRLATAAWSPETFNAGDFDLFQEMLNLSEYRQISAAARQALDNLARGDVEGFWSAAAGDSVFEKVFTNVLEQMQYTYDLDAMGMGSPEEAAYQLMFGSTGMDPEQYRRVWVQNAAGDQYGLDFAENTVSVAGDTAGLEEAINAQDGQTITTDVAGDTTDLAAAIDAQNGKTITVNVAAGRAGEQPRGLASAAAGYDPTGYFAEGGRADRASIFGEAGPEWAIPEAHSQATAELLNAAREASGFTWPELLRRNGGLNSGSGRSWTLVYSPTIVAQDARDVEEKLKSDKARLEKWLRDRQLREETEAYV